MTKNIKIKIQFTYIIDSEYENFTLQLDENEKFIKSFKQIKIDLTVVQILPKDKISEVYFYLLILIIRIKIN
jgi:phosphopantothenoylcysteine synthetase/decarboxylase